MLVFYLNFWRSAAKHTLPTNSPVINQLGHQLLFFKYFFEAPSRPELQKGMTSQPMVDKNVFFLLGGNFGICFAVL